MNDMPESRPPKAPSNVIDGAIPIRKRPAAGQSAEPRKKTPGTEESRTRRAHRVRMKEFLEAARSVA